MDPLLVLLAVVACAFAGALILLAIGLCRAARRADEPEFAEAPRAARFTRRRRDEAEARLALLGGRR